jgi:hypothetical protein
LWSPSGNGEGIKKAVDGCIRCFRHLLAVCDFLASVGMQVTIIAPFDAVVRPFIQLEFSLNARQPHPIVT